ncbi:MAG: ATP-binding cassette domain-containing protein, partial [Polaromonas sp.]|nr:ATP-binding cassette domain-containing protein [Polaromonas sp.]
MSAPGMPANLLDVRGLRIAFAGKEVVRGIDFSIAPGEKLALVGESGSGKTVTALSLLRLVQNADLAGSARFTARQSPGAPVDLLGLTEQQLRGIRGRDIAMIFQEPMTALNPLFSVGDQIAEVLQLKEGFSQLESAQAAIKLLADTGIQEPERRAKSFPHQLSGGQRQRAMIAMALACQPQLLLADEPTTALDVTLRVQILDLLAELQKRNGMAVLLITHDLNLVRRFADRVAVMEDGLIVEQGRVEDVFSAPQHAYTRKLIDSKPVRDVADGWCADPAGATPAVPLEAHGLRVAYKVSRPGFSGWFKSGEFVAVKNASLAIAPGRTLGVIGESGSGKSTLALAALGLLEFGGELRVAGQAWGQTSASDRALRRIVQVVFQDPFSSLSPRLTVGEIVEEGLTVHETLLTPAERSERAQQCLADVGLTETQFPNLQHRYPHEFSGGQRQRLAIARALIVNPALLVLDEPTSALDVTIQKQVLSLLQRLQRERGLSYLLITHDVD